MQYLLLPLQCQVQTFPFFFSTKIVNIRAYSSDTQVINTRATDHIICSVSLLSTITAIAQSIVEQPNGETASITCLLLPYLLLSLFIMFYVCHHSLLTFFLLVPSLNHNHVALFSSLTSVLSKTLLLGEQLEWDKQLMICTYYSLVAFNILLQTLLLVFWLVTN